jgi:uncharacterized protein
VSAFDRLSIKRHTYFAKKISLGIMMYVTTLHARLRYRESRTLKDKRQVVRSICDKLRSSFHVACTEVGHLDDVKVLELGIAAVGVDSQSLHGLMQKIQDALRSHPVAEYLHSEIKAAIIP